MTLLLLALPLAAQRQIVSTAAGVVVAHDGKLHLFGDDFAKKWTADGVTYPGAIVYDEHEVALLDPIANYVRIVNLRDGASREWKTGSTPIDGAYAKGRLTVLCRDEQTLERSDGVKLKLGIAVDLLRAREGKLFLYGRVTGALLEIDPATMSIVRQLTIAPFASDFAVDDDHIYFVYPALFSLHTYRRDRLEKMNEMKVGPCPLDIELAADPTPLSARLLWIADPVAKRVYVVQGFQSTSAAVAYGFIRGVRTFGLSPNRRVAGADFEKGVDRVEARGDRALGYETVSGALYRLGEKNKKPLALATGVAPGAYALTKTDIVWWDGSTLRHLPF